MQLTTVCASCGDTVHSTERCSGCGNSPLLDGRYSLREVLGHTPTRTTYRAIRVADGEAVAIKELLFRKMQGVKTLELFERETEVLGSLEHPSIPPLIEGFAVERGKRAGCYLVRAFVEGESLADVLSRGPVSLASSARLGADVLDALDYLHELRPPVVHRDVTPANVLRRVDGTLALIDFGAVRAAAAPDGSTIAGTFGAMAPEQLRGLALPASDIYGVGALILSLASGQPADALLGRGYRLRTTEHLPAGPLRTLVERMLRADPKRRPQTARELARALRRAAEDPVRSARAPWLAATALAAGVLAAGLAMFGTSFGAMLETTSEARLTADPPPAPPVEPAPTPAPSPVHASGLLPLRPAPLPGGFNPACLADETCAGVADGFLGLNLDTACGPLIEPDGSTPEASRGRTAQELRLGGVSLSCVPHQQNGHFCNVLCESAPQDAWAMAEQIVREVGDQHGFPSETRELQRRRTWTWREQTGIGAPEVLVLAESYGTTGRLTVSYRGEFGRSR